MPFLTDLRLALRLLARSPVFTVTAIASLALGIGSSAATFSLADALILAPPAGVRDPAAVVDIGRSDDGEGFDNMSYPMFAYLRDHAQTLAAMAAVEIAGGPLNLGANGQSERVFGKLVSGNYFDLLGARPALGRFFADDEDRVPDEKPVVVLSHAFWMRRFSGDPGVLGRPLRLNNRDFAVVGIAEEGFQGAAMIGTDLWMPMALVAAARGHSDSRLLREPGSVWHVAVGRLGPGVDRREAQAELRTLAAAFKAGEPRANERHDIAMSPLQRIPPPVRLPFKAFVGFLLALTGTLVAIACSNVAGMLLARATARRREMATRLAVGAGRGRLIAQLMTESLVLFVAGGVVALPVATWLVALLEGFLPALPFPIAIDLAVNGRVVAFALGASLLTAFVFGLAPARHALSGGLAPMLHGANSTVDRGRFQLRNALVVAQVALSLTLVVVAFLFLQALQTAAQIDPGFSTANIEIATLDVSLSGYRGQEAARLADRFEERVRAIPGVVSAATARMIPLQGGGFGMGWFRVPGVEGPGEGGTWHPDWNLISPGYFETIDMPIVSGRAFSPADRDGAPRVVIVNETFASRAWPGRSPIGQRILHVARGEEERAIDVVGVARDAKYRYISDAPRLFVYLPMAQNPTSQIELFVRHEGRPMGSEIRAALVQVVPNVPIVMLQSFEDAAAIGLLPQRVAAWIAGGVGVVGVFLAALGLYGLMAFLVAERTREIAIRMALGATGIDVRRMVMMQAARLGLAGGLTGLAAAAGVGVLARTLLVGVSPMDPLAFGATVAFFAIVLMLACWAPARRAAGTDPAAALRAE
jgi:putative ABC transport system permease protein